MVRALLASALLLALPGGMLHAQSADTPSQAARPYYVGHRYFMDRGIGWGWVKKPGETWSRGQWVALKENPEKGYVAPFRKLRSRSADHDVEYKLYGYFADYKAYDPKFNDLLPVFVIEGYETIGPAAPLDLRPGSIGQVRERASRASSRPNKPILNQGD